MANEKVFGYCRLCGNYGRLTFEHLPPRSAFNERPILHIEIEKLLASDSLENPRGPQNQRGAGDFLLCRNCNNDMGRWYVPQYSSWAQQGMEFLLSTRGPSSLIHRFVICPMNVFKQVAGMMCCVNSPKFTVLNPEVRRFVLNRASREWNPKFRIFMNFNISTRNRYSGGQGILVGTKIHVISEITFPPFSYLMTHECDPPSRNLLVDITFFAESLYDELREVWMNLPVVDHYTPLPGDYRCKEEVLKQASED